MTRNKVVMRGKPGLPVDLVIDYDLDELAAVLVDKVQRNKSGEVRLADGAVVVRLHKPEDGDGKAGTAAGQADEADDERAGPADTQGDDESE
jgi:hypothetical protein